MLGRRKSKAPTAIERRHMDRVAQMGCLVCGGEAAIHHIISNGYHRITRTHRLIAPLCPRHHQHGPEVYHEISDAGFRELHGIDLYPWAVTEWDRSQKIFGSPINQLTMRSA